MDTDTSVVVANATDGQLGVALKALMAKGLPKGELPPGLHTVNATVTISGVVRKGECSETLVAPALDWKKVALAALSKLNPATVHSLLRQMAGLDDLEALEEGFRESVESAFSKLVVKEIAVRDGATTVQTAAVTISDSSLTSAPLPAADVKAHAKGQKATRERHAQMRDDLTEATGVEVVPLA